MIYWISPWLWCRIRCQRSSHCNDIQYGSHLTVIQKKRLWFVCSSYQFSIIYVLISFITNTNCTSTAHGPDWTLVRKPTVQSLFIYIYVICLCFSPDPLSSLLEPGRADLDPFGWVSLKTKNKSHKDFSVYNRCITNVYMILAHIPFVILCFCYTVPRVMHFYQEI